MGAGKSRLKSTQCSKADFTNTETLNVIASTQNSKNAKDNDIHGRNTSNNNTKVSIDFDCVRSYVERPRAQRECNDAYACNSAVANCDVNSSSPRKYSLEPLTAEQQLEEIEKVFQEGKREKAGEMPAKLRRSHGAAKTRTTCCNDNCNCARTKKLPYRVEQRNGLQNLSPLGGAACRCSMCNGRMGELSEAEAIADAITEYCCRERKRTHGKANKSRRCCKCNGELQAENWRQQELESDDERETDTEIELEIETEDICYCSQHNREERGERRRTKCCKCAAEKKRPKQNQLEEEEMDEEMVEMEETLEEAIEEHDVVEEEFIDEEEYTVMPMKQRNSGQAHAKGCRCCDCKKEQGLAELSEEEEQEISVEDIELEVQIPRTEKTRKLSAVAPQSRHQSVSSRAPENITRPEKQPHDGENRNLSQPHVKGCRCCDCKNESKKRGTIEENEVLLKKTNLEERAEESVKEMRRKSPAKDLPTRDVYQDNRPRLQRSRSNELYSVMPKSQGRTHAKDCRCCDCKNGKPIADRRISMRSKEGSVDSIEIEIKTEAQREKQTRLRRSIEDESQSRRDHSRSRQEKQERATSDSVQNREASVLKNKAKPHEATVKEHQSNRFYNRDQTNQKPYTKSGRRETQEHEKVVEATAAQQRRRAVKKAEDDPSQAQPHGQGCSCCDCKQKYEAVEKIQREEPPAVEQEVEMEPEKQQNCCCFTRKRSQRKSDEGGDNSCCKCSKERSAEKGKRSSERKEGAARREHPEKEARSKKSHHCERECSCKKKKGVPLTKCCKCGEDEHETAYASSKQRYREEDRPRRKLAEELADRLQRRAQLQIELQKRLQDHLKAKQKQRCCCDPPPCCFAPYPCCEPVPMSCCEPQTCCFQSPPSCYPPPSCCFPQPPPPCCYEPPPCYGQECPCCCQPMPYCYTASCSYTKPGSCP